jgi:ligand-binding sensor domain-containing protein
MRISHFLLCVFISVSAFGQQAANQFRRIDNEWGLSNNRINTVFSDSRGFMWFATVSGLNRYDGYNFRVFKNIPGDATSLPENSIHNIYEDHLGYLWMFTTNTFYIYAPCTESFSTEHEIFNKNIPLSRVNINTVRKDSSNNLWISNNQLGLYYYNSTTDVLHRLYHNPDNERSLSSDRVLDVAFCPSGYVYAINQLGLIDVIDPKNLEVVKTYQLGLKQIAETYRDFRLLIDSDGDLWLYSINPGYGVYFINKDSGQVRWFSSTSLPTSLSSNIVTGVIEEKRGRIWVATDLGGVNIISKNDFSVEVLTNIPGDDTSVSGNSLTSIHKSKDGIIWVGTFKNGVNFYHEHLFQFNLYRSEPYKEKFIFSNDVNCFAEDDKGNLWIGTNGDGLVYFNRTNNTFKTYRHNPKDIRSIGDDVIVALHTDHRGRLWVGTYQGGLNCFDGSGFKRFQHNPNDYASLADDRVWTILEDSRNRLWVGTLGGGLDLYDERTNRFIHHRVGDFNSVSSDYILSLAEDKDGNLWIGTSSGVDVLDFSNQRFRHYASDDAIETSLSHGSVLSILCDGNERIWIGTRNGLNLYVPQSDDFKVFRETDGLPDHNIISMQDDGMGNVWISTLNGLSNLVYNDDSFRFRNYDLRDGLQGREFNEHSSYKTKKGELVFGGANGFNIFHPNEITDHKNYFQVLLTDFKLQNKSINIGEEIRGSVILTKALNLTTSLSLKHHQNAFSIEFSALNYFHPERTRFRYRLDGFNDAWIETDSKSRIATYTNINAGTYTFRVQASGTDGTWGTDETVLAIEVIPPFYATKNCLFNLFYSVCFVSLVISFYHQIS